MTLYGSQVMAVDFPNGFYAGASGGAANQSDFCTLAGGSNLCDDNDFAWKIYGGYQFWKWISLEAGYADLGEADSEGQGSGSPILLGPSDTISSQVDGWTLAVPFTLPILDRIGLYGKLGGFIWDGEIEVVQVGIATTKISDNGTSFFWGAGLRYPFTEKFGIIIEYERYEDVGESAINIIGGTISAETDIEVYSAGFVWRF